MSIEQYYIEKGDGYPLILLHGNGESSGYFSHQIDEFSKRYHVYAPDTRGHGKTPHGVEPLTIRQFAIDLKEFMDNHKIEKADLLGFSDGANIAMVFAICFPKMVNRLILNGGNLYPSGVKWRYQAPIEAAYRVAVLFSSRSAKALRRAELLGLMVNDPNIDPNSLSDITAKTLVIAGTKDMIRKKHTELIANSIPDAQLVFIKGDHFIANKNSDVFNAVVLRFLNA